MAVLTKGLLAIVRAIVRAVDLSRHPRTVIVIRWVAPSPSAGILRASSAHTAYKPSRKAARASPAETSARAAPFASRSTVSLVLICPSTWMQLKVSSTISASIVCAKAGEIAASVRTIPSIVAMRGPIMAAPFARPVMVYKPEGSPAGRRQLAIFGTVSVVIIPRAAESSARSSLASCFAASEIPALIASIGK